MISTNLHKRVNIDKSTEVKSLSSNLHRFILMNLPWWVDIVESTPKYWYQWIYTKPLILMDPFWWVNIDKSALTGWCKRIYTEERRVDIDEYTQKSRYQNIYPNGSMNPYWQINVDESTPISWYLQISTKEPISTNLLRHININKCTWTIQILMDLHHQIDFNKSILMDLPSFIDIRESTMTGW